MIAFLDLHRIAKSPRRSGNNGNLLYRCRICLLCSHKCMPDFMICHNTLFFICQYCIFLLISGDNNLNTLLQIFLRYKFTVVTNCTKRCFIYNISKFSSRSSGSHTCHFIIIYIITNFYFLCMNLQDIFSSFQIRKFYRHTSVEPSRS